MSIYLNNGATTWPKPPGVAEAVSGFITGRGANLARGSSSGRDIDTLDLVTSARMELASLFGGYGKADSRYVTFTSNVTESLNVVLKGFLRPGMHAATTSMEHNSVIRPLRRLESEGVRVTILECDRRGFLDPGDLESLFRSQKVDLFVLSHASNVCGTIQPLEDIATLCRGAGVPCVLDSAQTAGVLPIDTSALGLAALCFTGHKGLMGPQGIGGIVWAPDFAKSVSTFIEGGTGSFSDEETHPEKMPDRFEAGTPNLPGTAGLFAALKWISSTGITEIYKREKELGKKFHEGIRDLKGLRIYGMDGDTGRLAVYGMNFSGLDNGTAAMELSERWGIETRPGLHCAPRAHRTLGSFPQGALRISIGYFNTEVEVDKAIEALASLAKENPAT
ncbi:MAG TPA: aminotransferase class V-fold PLP-dependent enzyme [Synergistetes bacterium]|nr:aminotransferase class V-fold PLP-dependent enzyme [Synergistota bacterium]